MTPKITTKRLMIDQANKRVILATSIAAFVVIFSAVASQSLFSQMMYQNRVIGAKKQALVQLEKDKEAVKDLESSYKAFVSTPQNVIGGSAGGTSDRDGDNAKIVLDALPSKYDFPALATSLEKLLVSQSLEIKSISGTDDELAQSTGTTTDSPQFVPVPFQVAAQGDYQSIQNLTTTFERSIRPIKVQTLTISGDQSSLEVTVGAETYYQPAKQFNLGKKVIK